MRSVVLLSLSLCEIACSRQQQQENTVGDRRQAVLDDIADSCGLARATFKLNGKELHVQPPADSKYEAVDCALTKLRDAKLPVNIGFVGNEYYVENEQ